MQAAELGHRRRQVEDGPTAEETTRREEKLMLPSLLHRFLLQFGIDLVPVGDSTSGFVPQIRQGMKDAAMLLNGCEAYQIMSIAQGCVKLPGVFAEVGVYRGGSAKLISQVAAGRQLLLFDTFEGLPAPAAEDSDSHFRAGDYKAGMIQVRKYLGEPADVILCPGLFPSSASAYESYRFCFVHLDVDLYEATRDSLAWFYPRMVQGGCILCHDYVHPGVRKAVDEFFVDKPEFVLRLPAGAHCLVVKR